MDAREIVRIPGYARQSECMVPSAVSARKSALKSTSLSDKSNSSWLCFYQKCLSYCTISHNMAKTKPFFEPLSPSVDFPKLEEELLKEWNKKGIVKKYLEKNKSSKKIFRN